MVGYRTNLRPFSFNNYGRYCGLGGTGNPLDAVDQCCLQHDQCYIGIGGNECNTVGGGLAPFVMKYQWKKLPNGTIICDESQSSDKVDTCAIKICNCDRMLTECFLKNSRIFNDQNKKTLMWRVFEKTVIRWIFPNSL
ncbi:hypothetical protein CHUAL_003428 [Chamberlinius hualienensis]